MSEDTGTLLRQVAQRWQAAHRSALEPHGLTPVQHALMGSLLRLEAQPKKTVRDRVNQRRLADHAGVDPMVTSQVVRALEGLGLLERLPDDRDRRAKVLASTAEGRERVEAAAPDVQAAGRAFFAPLEDAPAFAGALRALLGS